jgi:hypothetical protein
MIVAGMASKTCGSSAAHSSPPELALESVGRVVSRAHELDLHLGATVIQGSLHFQQLTTLSDYSRNKEPKTTLKRCAWFDLVLQVAKVGLCGAEWPSDT